MITDKLIDTLSKSIQVETIIESNEDTDYLITVLYFRSREVYRHRLDLSPLYDSFLKRVDSHR